MDLETQPVGNEDTTNDRAVQSKPQGKLRRVSQACTNCRRRKIKCKGLTKQKACDSCIALRTECVLVRDGDRRRVGSREQVSVLQHRIQRLESALAASNNRSYCNDSGIDVLSGGSPTAQDNSDAVDQDAILALSPGNAFEDTTLRNRDQNEEARQEQVDAQHHHIRNESGSFMQQQHQSPQTAQVSSEINVRRSISYAPNGLDPQPDQQNDSGVGPFNEPGFTSVSTFQQVSPQGHPSVRSEHTDGHLEMDESLGQTHFYGQTSQPYIQSNTGRNKTPDDIANDGIDQPTLNPDAGPIVETLLDTFFRAQPLTVVVVVDKQAFQADRQFARRTQRWSAFLQHSILACATRMSTSAEVRKLGVHFASRARADITSELDNPTMATLSGFLLLSDFEATRGRDRLGSMYCGIASTLVFDLGLTECCAALVSQGRMTVQETEQRHTLLIAAYVFDKLWAMYLGRPSGVPVDMVARAYNRAVSRGWRCPASLEQWLGLCTEMSQVTELLIGSSLLEDGVVYQLLTIDGRIESRPGGMSKQLQLIPGSIAELDPSSYALQIQFYGTRVVIHNLIHKAMQAVDPSASHTMSSVERSQRIKASRKIMCEGAVTVARLVHTYSTIYGYQQTVTIMLDNMYVSAAILVSYALHWQHQGDMVPDLHPEHWIHVLADLLSKTQHHYPVATRMLLTLANTVNNTALAGVFDTQTNGHNDHSRSVHPVQDTAQVGTMTPARVFQAGTQARTGLCEDHPLLDDLFGDPNGMSLFSGSAGNALDWTLPSLVM